LNTADIRREQRDYIPIDLEHGLAIGRVAHLELASDGSLMMVGEVHGALRDGPLFCSPRCTQRQDTTDLVLDAVALTETPAQILMTPVMVIDGGIADYRRSLPDQHAQLFERARSAAERRRYGDPIVVHGAGDSPPTGSGWINPDGSPARGPGLWHGQPGAVLRVR
jgi:hypothetical protein